MPGDLMGINRRGRKRAVKDVKDDEEDEEEDGEDGEADCEKTVPEDVNPERLKAFNVRLLQYTIFRNGQFTS